ncbi:MAG TPA: GNAT family N-acetyltransferase [Acidimicrobiales bacterium]|nr:GNAT family N-acetyltransferase [Acidimicrobiales bacterium]
MSASVRAARDEDLAALREIERASGQRYRDHGLAPVADDEPAPIEVLSRYAADGRAWVAVDPDDHPVGYLLVDEVDGAAHIEQVSVLPDHQGRGVGRMLIDRADGWAGRRAMTALTLTTFGHIPWNRPLYEHLGFRVLGEDELGPGLRAVRDAEAAHGLDPDLRVVMRREVEGAVQVEVAVEVAVQVRRASRHDVGPAAEVYLRSRKAAVPAIPPPVHHDDEVGPWLAETVNSERELWIAEAADGQLVGMMVLDADFVEQLYVDPAHTGGGVGSKLLAMAKSLRPRGLQLWTFQSNERARRFYEGRGFSAVESTDGRANEERAPDVRYVWEPDQRSADGRRT